MYGVHMYHSSWNGETRLMIKSKSRPKYRNLVGMKPPFCYGYWPNCRCWKITYRLAAIPTNAFESVGGVLLMVDFERLGLDWMRSFPSQFLKQIMPDHNRVSITCAGRWGSIAAITT